MHSLNNRGVHTENLRILPNCDPNKMDYRQKMIVPSPQIMKHEDEDDEDLDALRLAALKSLGAKHMPRNTHRSALLSQQVKSRAGYLPCPSYNHQRQPKRGFYQNRPPRQNGNTYYPSRVNQNLIEIVPVEEEEATQENDVPPIDPKKLQTEPPEDGRGDSKFYRYKDNQSGSEEEDNKESNNASTAVLPPSESEWPEKGGGEGSGLDRDIPSGLESPRDHPAEEEVLKEALPGEDDAEVVGLEEQEEEEDEEEAEAEEVVMAENEEEDQEGGEEEKSTNDDDDDVLLMADLEEEDSLERLMDEMEREMNKLDETKDKKPAKKESKESKKVKEVPPKVRSRKSRVDQENERNGPASGSISNSSWTQQTFAKTERRSVSPRAANKTSQKRRSLSPKARLRKKSPRRSSPRRSPLRGSKKSFRDGTRIKSPRKLSPVSSRFSPRPRSPKSSPRGRSPSNRSPLVRRSPSAPRKLSPRERGRSPHSRSPKIRRSRSPRLISRSRSPVSRLARSPAPRVARSPAPRLARSPASRLARSPKCTKRSKSPKISRSRTPRPRTPRSRTPRPRTPRSNSPRMMSPSRTSSPRCRSPRPSPGRLASSPRPRSPKLTSPDVRRRGSPTRTRSPIRHSPAHRSPWSSPRNSPRLSPRRRRSPKESTRKTRQRSITPDVEAAPPSRPAYKREPTSPLRKTASSSPDVDPRSKGKQKDPLVANSGSRDNSDATNDPILEARRRKFECTKPIDPVQDNKKIKLSKRECTSKTCIVTTEDTAQLVDSPKSRKTNKLPEDVYSDVPETDLCLTEDYVYDVLEVTSDESSAPNTVAMCVEMVPVKVEKERSKKKKKRDKEIYQVGKLKGELPLSERIGKEKKWKNRNDRDTSPLDSSPERAIVLEDIANDGEEADLRTELSRRRAERLNRVAPIQSARLLQSAFKGVVNEVAKNNAKATQRHADKGDDKNSNKKEVRRVTVLHRTVTDLADSEDEAAVDSKVPIRFRLGINKPAQENNRESKTARKSSKRQGRKKVR